MPNATRAWVRREKITLYLLNAAHPKGQSKARFFRDRGFGIDRWQELGNALSRHPLTDPLASRSSTPHGTKFVVQCSLETPDGRHPCITTVWLDEGDGRPRLVTARPN